VSADLSFFHLLSGASLLVQLVMLLLLVASIFSWALIYRKGQQLGQDKRAAEAFEDRFWSGGELAPLYKELAPRREQLQGLERIFEAGFSEFARLRQQTHDPDQTLAGAMRAMRVVLSRETDRVEAHLPFLATVGSISPYVGLFGTVWGIMNSFRALGVVQQATLAMVAPGIAEALIATAMGLFAAIPAVVAYNRFVTESDRLLNSYDNFIEEFATLLHRQSLNLVHENNA